MIELESSAVGGKFFWVVWLASVAEGEPISVGSRVPLLNKGFLAGHVREMEKYSFYVSLFKIYNDIVVA